MPTTRPGSRNGPRGSRKVHPTASVTTGQTLPDKQVSADTAFNQFFGQQLAGKQVHPTKEHADLFNEFAKLSDHHHSHQQPFFGVTESIRAARVRNGATLLSTLLPTDLPTDLPTNVPEQANSNQKNKTTNQQNHKTNKIHWQFIQNIRGWVKDHVIQAGISVENEQEIVALLPQLLQFGLNQAAELDIFWDDYRSNAGIAIVLILYETLFLHQLYGKCYSQTELDETAAPKSFPNHYRYPSVFSSKENHHVRYTNPKKGLFVEQNPSRQTTPTDESTEIEANKIEAIKTILASCPEDQRLTLSSYQNQHAGPIDNDNPKVVTTQEKIRGNMSDSLSTDSTLHVTELPAISVDRHGKSLLSHYNSTSQAMPLALSPEQAPTIENPGLTASGLPRPYSAPSKPLSLDSNAAPFSQRALPVYPKTQLPSRIESRAESRVESRVGSRATSPVAGRKLPKLADYKTFQPIPPSPFNPNILPDNQYDAAFRDIRDCLTRTVEKLTIANVVRDLYDALVTQSSSSSTDDTYDKNALAAIKMAAYIGIHVADTAPGYNHLRGLGLDDSQCNTLVDLLSRITQEYRRFASNTSTDNTTVRVSYENLDPLNKIHAAFIDLYLKQLANSAYLDKPIQWIVLINSTIDESFENFPNAIVVLVKTPRSDGEIVTTEYHLQFSEVKDQYEFFYPSQPYKVYSHLKPNSEDESYGQDIYHYQFTGNETRDNSTDGQRIAEEDEEAMDVTILQTIPFDLLFGTMLSTRSTHVETSKQLAARYLTWLEANPELSETHFLIEQYAELLLEKRLILNIINYCSATNKNIEDLEENELAALRQITLETLKEEAQILHDHNHSITKIFTCFKPSSNAFLKNRVLQLMQMHPFVTAKERALPNFLSDLISKSAIQQHYNAQAPHARNFFQKLWERHPKKIIAAGVLSTFGLVITGILLAQPNANKTCDGIEEADGSCKPVTDPDCKLLTPSNTTESGTVQLQLDCQDPAAAGSAHYEFLVDVPPGSTVTADGESIPVTNNQFNAAPVAGKNIDVTLPGGYNGGHTFNTQVNLGGNTEPIRSETDPIDIVPQTGKASVSNIGGDFVLNENGNATFKMRFRPDPTDDAVLKFVRGLPIGHQLTATDSLNNTVSILSNATNQGHAEIPLPGNDLTLVYTPSAGESGEFNVNFYGVSVEVDSEGQRFVGQIESDPYIASFTVYPQAAIPESINAPEVLKVIEGGFSHPFNITGQAQPGDQLGRKAIIPPGGELRNDNGQTFKNDGDVARTIDISGLPKTDWRYRYEGDDRGDLVLEIYGADGDHESDALTRTVVLDQFAKPTVSFKNPSTNATVTGIQFNEDTAGSVLLNVDYPAGTNNASVVLTFPAVQSASDFPGNYKVTGKTADGSTTQAESTIVNGKPVIDVSNFNLAQPLNITAPPNINIDNQGGEIPVNVKVTAEHADGRLAGSDGNFGLDVSSIPENGTFIVPNNPPGSTLFASPGSSTFFSGHFNYDESTQLPAEKRGDKVLIYSLPANTHLRRWSPRFDPNRFDEPVSVGNDTHPAYEVAYPTLLGGGVGIVGSNPAETQNAVPGSYTSEAIICNTDGEVQRCFKSSFPVQVRPGR